MNAVAHCSGLLSGMVSTTKDLKGECAGNVAFYCSNDVMFNAAPCLINLSNKSCVSRSSKTCFCFSTSRFRFTPLLQRKGSSSAYPIPQLLIPDSNYLTRHPIIPSSAGVCMLRCSLLPILTTYPHGRLISFLRSLSKYE